MKQTPLAMAIPRSPRSQPIPVSYAQRRLWFMDRLEPNSAAYNMPFALRLEGALDTEILRRSFELIVHRHEVLRTTFEQRDGEPFQRIHAPMRWSMPVIDLSGRPAHTRDTEARRLEQEEASRPFELERGPLLRTTLVKCSDAEHLLLVTMHHIISDGWSTGVMMSEFATNYEGLRRGGPPTLPELPIQYADHALWQRQMLSGPLLEEQLAYWRKQLADMPPALRLPLDRPRPAKPSHKGAEHVVWIPLEIATGLRELAHREGATLFMVLLAAFQLLLSRLTGQEDIAVGTPIAGRMRRELEGLIGFFVNTLVLRADSSGNPSFAQFLARVTETTLNAYANQDVPFDMLVERLAPRREPGLTPLFQVMFTVQNAWTEGVRLEGLTATPREVHGGTAKFDLMLQVRERADGLEAMFEYSTELFDAATVERMGRCYATLLEGLRKTGGGARCRELRLLGEGERRQLLEEWNRTASDFPRERCVHELFEEQAELHPEAIAVEAEGESLTYRELNLRANRVAHALRERGVAPESRVGLCVERSPEMLVAMLGILKAGGAYVPLDPRLPAERLSFMTRDVGLQVVVASRAHRPVAERLGEVLEPGSWLGESSATANPVSGARAENLVYVMYTSGSTGEPKGVAIEHRNVNRLVRGANYVHLGPDEVFLQLAPSSFDASTFEIWGCLLNGGRLVLPPPKEGSLRRLSELLEQHGVTTLWLTAGLFHQFVQEDVDGLARVRQVLAGGDVLSPWHVRRFLERGGRRLINGYGPTETTTFACCHRMERPEQVGESVSIGRPIANTTAYVVDTAGELVPMGVAGELWIGGEGVGRGYWNRPELTAARFLGNPWGPGRLYRTGDRVRWRADGTLEYLGRIDFQVKLRGFRIEPGEVEAVLRRHPEVRDAVVLVREEPPGDKRLVAYVATAAHEAPSNRENLRQYLHRQLPDYMVPSAFVPLPTLPLTPNGKVDRRALPAPEVPVTGPVVPPRDRLELMLSELWREALHVPNVGVTQNFFELGGHSLLALGLMTRIERQLGRRLPVASLFTHPTIEQLATLLRQERIGRDGNSPLVPLRTEGSRPPLFCVHPIGGSVLGYGTLVRHLDVDQPVYGLEAPSLDGTRPVYPSLEAMAADYLQAVRQVQPEGPYRLAGWSMGGVVAFEMARQLTRSGARVELLALLDSWSPMLEPQEANAPLDELALLELFAHDMARAIGHPHPLFSPEELARRDLEERRALLLERAHGLGLLPPDVGREMLDALLRTFRAHEQALRHYVPQTLPVDRVVLFRPDEPASNRPPLGGWNTVVPSELELRRVPGDHYSMMAEPHVRELARQLRDML
ncbi:Long-chain-fatty-acid--CoA ligase [Cystobacter fuscus DSM 2262]|uniref:Long-chain-fatty-acid--CoA ligase n=1 Tax=Cystobacter fuscus (strain ATCC 25194 / DSM 2262 / NBRC 100088 / M29) TaxID=1242864 RepID=S9QCF0_CYSF2|nr:non-ribosomal peptide synthetase [Cystobacter fuscus]EPX59029.1 Long-chain-fatty-acid--CoA ligase [Cystobacter fuscus DSM 2262]